eukprot:scaffold201170_cov33-Tisochrysis_lutea.AAC.5
MIAARFVCFGLLERVSWRSVHAFEPPARKLAALVPEILVGVERLSDASNQSSHPKRGANHAKVFSCRGKPCIMLGAPMKTTQLRDSPLSFSVSIPRAMQGLMVGQIIFVAARQARRPTSRTAIRLFRVN